MEEIGKIRINSGTYALKDETARNLIYKDNYSMSVSPTLIEKGVEKAITMTITGNRSLAWNTNTVSDKYTASEVSVVDGDGASVTVASTGTSSSGYSYLTVSNAGVTATYKVSCILNKLSKTFSGTVTAVYPKYYGSNAGESLASDDVLALTKQGLSTTAGQSGVKVSVKEGEYLWLCVPSGMTVSLVKDANTNIEVSMLSYTPTSVAVEGKGTYNCYRSQYTMNNTETLTLNITA